MSTLLAIIEFIAAMIYMLYSMAWNFRIWAWNQKVKHATREICLELRVFALVAIPIDAWNYIATTHDNIWIRAWLLLVYTVYEILAVRDKDDRWKKRRKKLASKVKEVAGRLVVVPMPVPVGA